jgi:DNA-binding MarR family transcriptional regulator
MQPFVGFGGLDFLDPGRDETKVGEKELAVLRQGTIAFVRAFGLHRPETTPCGQPLPVSEAHALMELDQDGPLPQTALASRLRLDKSTVSRLVDNLEGKGWIERARDPGDGRGRRLVLTEPGRKTAERIAVARAARFDGMLRRIAPEERAAVLRALAVLADAADGAL